VVDLLGGIGPICVCPCFICGARRISPSRLHAFFASKVLVGLAKYRWVIRVPESAAGANSQKNSPALVSRIFMLAVARQGGGG